jgi:hypothetical protein
LRDVTSLFSWPPELGKRTVEKLMQAGKLVEAEHPQKPGLWLVMAELVG